VGQVVEKTFCVNIAEYGGGVWSEEFTSAFETHENTIKYKRFGSLAGGDTPPEYVGNSSSFLVF